MTHEQNQPAKYIADLDNLISIQTSQGTLSEGYMRGMANGLICARSVFTGEEPKYIDPMPAPLAAVPAPVPLVWTREKPIEPGLYFIRQGFTDRSIVNIKKASTGDLFFDSPSVRVWLPEVSHLEWAGPIPSPVDTGEAGK